jgi:hypothetical protein
MEARGGQQPGFGLFLLTILRLLGSIADAFETSSRGVMGHRCLARNRETECSW